MKFFTDKTVECPYLLIKIKDYIKLKGSFPQKKEVFIDPGVYELKKFIKYSWEGKLDVMKFVGSLPANHYFTLDYPCDMNPLQSKLFIEKSWSNALFLYQFPQYIVTVQYKIKDYMSFVYWFNKYNNLNIESGILGLGNMCRIKKLTEFLKHSLDYAFSHCKHKRIHIYGLCLEAIPYAEKLAKRFNIKLSVDSTKWTFMYYERPKGMFTRQEDFEAYKDKIIAKGVILE